MAAGSEETVCVTYGACVACSIVAVRSTPIKLSQIHRPREHAAHVAGPKPDYAHRLCLHRRCLRNQHGFPAGFRRSEDLSFTLTLVSSVLFA